MPDIDESLYSEKPPPQPNAHLCYVMSHLAAPNVGHFGSSFQPNMNKFFHVFAGKTYCQLNCGKFLTIVMERTFS